MPKNDIGGFFVSLGLNIDKNSFETGNRLIDNVGNSFNKLIGSARNAAVVLAGTAIATGSVESASYKTATALGVTTEALEVWRASAKIAGVSADSLVASIGKIAGVQNRLKYDNSGLPQLQSQLDKLKMSYSEIQNLSADKATQKILEKAKSMLSGNNTAEIAAYVEDILGAGARDFLIETNRRGMSISAALAEAGDRVYTNRETNENAQNFITEVRLLKQASESMSKLLGSEVADQLTGYVQNINKWIDDHGTDIANGISTVAEGVGKFVGKLVDFVTDEDVQEKVKKGAEVLKESIEDTWEGNKKMLSGGKDILTGNFEEGVEKIKEGGAQTFSGTTAPVVEVIESEPVATGIRRIPVIGWISRGIDKVVMNDEEYDNMWGENGLVNQSKNKKKMKDGIMRPDGTITQVAPDDWVFAARNLGDLARAFIPQNHTAVSAGEYTINQTFNISGGNDMPQVLRQQAYRGTQEGLLQLMEESSRRLQLMSATR